MKELYNKYKELVLYIVFGVLTTVINFVVYILCNKVMGIDAIISNVIAWIMSVVFAFVTNKLYVFDSKVVEIKFVVKEFTEFTLSRGATGVMDIALFYVLVSIMGINDLISKVIIGVIVTVLNYVLSKLYIFKREKDH